MIEKSKLIDKIIKQAKISKAAATTAYECILKENPAFRKQELKTVKAIKEVAVAVPGKLQVKEVKVKRDKVVKSQTTIEKIKKVPTKNNVALYKKTEKIKTVEVIKEVPVEVIKEVIKVVEKEVFVVQNKEVIKIKEVKVEVPIIKEIIKEVKVPVIKEVIKTVEVPVIKEVIKTIEVPVIKVETKIVEVEVPVIKEVTKIVEVKVPVIKEVIKEVEVPVVNDVIKEVEVAIVQENFKEVTKEIPIIQKEEVVKLEKVKDKVVVEKVTEKIKPIEVIKEKAVPVVKEIEVMKEVEKEIPVPVLKVETEIKEVEVIKEIPVIVEKPTLKEVKVVEKEPVEVIKEVTLVNEVVKEVIKEVEIEVIKEVEVVKQYDMKSLMMMLKKASMKESGRSVVGESRTTGDAVVVDRREVTSSTRTKVTGTPTKIKKKEGAKVSKKDDLTKIEGIGPKIASILAENGIRTFKVLADSKVSHLKQILENAGNRFKMHNPTTWPQQSQLAAEGKWEELQVLQDKLDGGR